MADDTINWPPLDAVYDDEFGTVDSTIYAAAGKQWPAARRFARTTLGDEADGLQLMIKATAIVSRRQVELEGDIKDPAAFLMQTFKRLVLGELKKHNRRCGLEDERQVELMPRTDDTADALDQKILRANGNERRPALSWLDSFFAGGCILPASSPLSGVA